MSNDLQSKSCEQNAISQALANIAKKSKPMESSVANDATSLSLTINFHPDRLTASGKPLLEAIAEDGELKSQFETGTSNGGLTAYQGGERWRWEQRVFDKAYDHVEDSARPKYGALNFRGYPTGGSPRFGSAFFTLKPQLLERASFCYPDSFFEPHDFALSSNASTLITLAEADNCDRLDDYIEAHIHGKIVLSRDVESLTLDPVYRGSEVEAQAMNLGVPVLWHAGYQLSVATLLENAEYRGAEIAELGEHLAFEGFIDAKLLGEALLKNTYDPQQVKKVWHCLARFGYANPANLD